MPSHWIKSSLSFSNSNCVEVADGRNTILVRDSKNPGGPVLRFTPDEWSAFLGGVRNGEFDSPPNDMTNPALTSAPRQPPAPS
jgi:hypothetical protein